MKLSQSADRADTRIVPVARLSEREHQQKAARESRSEQVHAMLTARPACQRCKETKRTSGYVAEKAMICRFSGRSDKMPLGSVNSTSRTVNIQCLRSKAAAQ